MTILLSIDGAQKLDRNEKQVAEFRAAIAETERRHRSATVMFYRDDARKVWRAWVESLKVGGFGDSDCREALATLRSLAPAATRHFV